MNKFSGRLKRLEQATKQARRSAWRIRFVEYEPVTYEETAAAVRSRALAAGWRPGDGPYAVFLPANRRA